MVQPGRGDTPVTGHVGHCFVKRATLVRRASGHERPGEPVQLVDSRNKLMWQQKELNFKNKKQCAKI